MNALFEWVRRFFDQPSPEEIHAEAVERVTCVLYNSCALANASADRWEIPAAPDPSLSDEAAEAYLWLFQCFLLARCGSYVGFVDELANRAANEGLSVCNVSVVALRAEGERVEVTYTTDAGERFSIVAKKFKR